MARRCPSHGVQITCLLLITASLAQPQSVVIGPSSDGSECCGQQLADMAVGRVIIETSRSLAANTYYYVRLRACSVDPVAVQLWRRVDDSTYVFRWQFLYTPTQAQTSSLYVTITLPSPVNVTADDRIGIYSSSANPLAIPFDSTNAASVYYSLNTFQSATFTTGLSTQLDTTRRWTRTFSQRLGFCQTQDCSELAQDIPVATAAPAQTCCQPETPLMCDPSPDVSNGFANTTQELRQLQQTIDALTNILNSIVSLKYVTGLCPQGFLSGSFGVGSCYLLFQTPKSLAEATMDCQQYSAVVLTIQSFAEDQFIRNFVQNNTVAGQSSITKFWTSGLYDIPSRTWGWFEGTTTTSLITTNTMTYTNWANTTAPIPTNSDEVCLADNVDGLHNTNYWTNEFCNRRYYYICEVVKRCM